MYAKGKGATVPSDAQAREKWVAIFIFSLGCCISRYVDITYFAAPFILYGSTIYVLRINYSINEY